MKSYCLLISVATLALTSCSIFTTQGKTVSGANAVAENKADITASDKPTAFDLPEKLDGEWQIITVDGAQISSDEMPYINFRQNEGRFFASDGCNIINGNYSVNQDRIISFTDVLSTMKYCPDVEYSAQIAALLSGAGEITIKIDKVGHENYLRFFNTSGREVMSARKHNMDFLNGNWKINSVRGISSVTEDATIFIDIPELKIHGNTGCNYFNGEIFLASDRSNAIDFSNLGSTRKACPNMDQESAIMLALEETASAIEGSDNHVMLLDSEGKELMTLRKIGTVSE